MRTLLLLLFIAQSVRGLIPPIRSHAVRSFPLPTKTQHVVTSGPTLQPAVRSVSKLTFLIRTAALAPLLRRLRVALATALLALTVLVGGSHSDFTAACAAPALTASDSTIGLKSKREVSTKNAESLDTHGYHSSSGKLAGGMKVKVRYRDKSRYYSYSGKIVRDNRDGTYDISYVDGDSRYSREMGVREDLIKPIPVIDRVTEVVSIAVGLVVNSLRDAQDFGAKLSPLALSNFTIRLTTIAIFGYGGVISPFIDWHRQNIKDRECKHCGATCKRTNCTWTTLKKATVRSEGRMRIHADCQECGGRTVKERTIQRLQECSPTQNGI